MERDVKRATIGVPASMPASPSGESRMFAKFAAPAATEEPCFTVAFALVR